MKLLDATSAFLERYDQESSMNLQDLESYHQQFPDLFQDLYFKGHCQPTPERLHAALERYPTDIDRMRRVISQLPEILAESAEMMSNHLHVEFEVDATMFVGAYGSNAWVSQSPALFCSGKALR